ncbi:MAG: ion transporter [Chthoniobacterales bacterium]
MALEFDQRLRKPIPIWWQVIILVASLAVLIVLVLTLFLPIPTEARHILDFADTAICAIFMTDFCILLYSYKNRWEYLYTWGWLDFISSIPFIGPLRWGRVARLLRLLRLFRGMRGSTGLLKQLFLERQKSTLLAICVLAVIVIVFGSVGILVAEQGSRSQINTAQNALWFTLTTMTTVGYGDLVPVTNLGRAVAVLTMIAGIGIFGAFTALVASLLLSSSKEGEEVDTMAVQLKNNADQIALLREEIQSLRQEISRSTDKK